MLQQEGKRLFATRGSEGIKIIIMKLKKYEVPFHTGINIGSLTESVSAAIELPGSLFGDASVTASAVGGGLGLVFSFYDTAVLFPLPHETHSDFEIRTPVIGALLADAPAIAGLADPIIVTLQLEIDAVSFLFSVMQRVRLIP